jgi:hypothetical protein
MCGRCRGRRQNRRSSQRPQRSDFHYSVVSRAAEHFDSAYGAFEQGTAHMNKRQIIEDIRRFNITVPGTFLAQFDEEALTQYLEHLEFARKKHLRATPWTRGQTQLRLVS